MAKPSDFFLGVTDLFSVLLPGAALTYVLARLELHEVELGRMNDGLGLLHWSANTSGYVAFLVLSYLVGHGTDMLGSVALDGLYDITYAHLKRSKQVSPMIWFVRLPGRLVVEARDKIRYLVLGTAIVSTTPTDGLYERAKALAEPLRPEGDRVFQWCRSWVLMKSPSAFLEIERVQGNSKFFRGMVATFVLVAGISLRYQFPFHARGAAVCLLLAVVSFLRYCDLRWKAVQQAYRLFIAMRADAAEIAMRSEVEENEDS